MADNGKKVAVISLGCDKNRVDTENILWFLGEGGYSATNDLADADVIIVNTCAFISSAEKEAVDTIFELQHTKRAAGAKLSSLRDACR